MTPIKKIAGEVLLYFYWLQRKDRTKLHDTVLSFQLRHFEQGRQETGPKLERREQSLLNIEEFSQYSDGDLYNALKYLSDYGLVTFTISKSNMDDSCLNFEVTAQGVDMIEGIERGESERNLFNVTFNFTINNDITVESLLKMELGSLVKASLL